jgi:PAS domain S-box-containing protein
MLPFLSALRRWRLLALEKASLYSKVTRELAERKKAEARIRESEQRYRSFLESSPDPIVVYNMKGVATYVNPAFEQTFGRSRHELLGKQIDFVPEECWPETKAAIDRMLSGRKITMFETKRLARDGQVLDVQISSTLFQDQNGGRWAILLPSETSAPAKSGRRPPAVSRPTGGVGPGANGRTGRRQPPTESNRSKSANGPKRR